MIPRDNPETVGVSDMELLNTSKSPWNSSVTRHRHRVVRRASIPLCAYVFSVMGREKDRNMCTPAYQPLHDYGNLNQH